jgi:cytochrome c oxidase subunit 4
MEHQNLAADGEPHEEHHGSTKKFVAVFIALCVLTSASIVTYTPLWTNYLSPQVGWAFMMAVSCAKAMLVITFFMHMYWEANWKYVLTIPAAMMSVFLICMLVPDIGYRTRHYTEERQYHDAVEKMHSGHGHAGEQAEHVEAASH